MADADEDLRKRLSDRIKEFDDWADGVVRDGYYGASVGCDAPECWWKFRLEQVLK